MAGGPDKNRLSPPLSFVFRASHDARDAKKRIDLRDAAGERVIAARRTTSRVAITEPILRREVIIDLTSLMNTVRLEATDDLNDFAFVRKSILNFGLPDIVHHSIDERGVDLILEEIEGSLKTYEPRLDPASIKVERDRSVEEAGLKIRFIIHADLLCDPLAVPITFVADVQADIGVLSISQQ